MGMDIHAADAREQPASDVLAERIKTVEQAISALDRLTTTRIEAQADKVGLALAAADKAVLKAEGATEKRFESVNEFRSQLSDQTKTFVSKVEFDTVFKGQQDEYARLQSGISGAIPRTEYVTGHKAVEDRIISLELTRSSADGVRSHVSESKSDTHWTIQQALVVVVLIVGMVEFVLRFKP